MKPLPRRLLGGSGYGLAMTAGLSLLACSGTGAPCATGCPSSYYNCDTDYYSPARHYSNRACGNRQYRSVDGSGGLRHRTPPLALYRGSPTPYPPDLPDPPKRARPY
ncbi:hypothetical protein [Microbulbifer spongiae]|uniref:Lipoprotein n=1 Tax=Microbulbifer spongiae TaxID=2944933 RepID=A0ABY9EE12_9GAMM|nr:hypothetical protein [Microbulbifer sp. MI-G]WKD49595.1 hypothetical protein M8T91_17160 [Microbulbifer sp. MI-G]